MKTMFKCHVIQTYRTLIQQLLSFLMSIVTLYQEKDKKYATECCKLNSEEIPYVNLSFMVHF
jgi:hypothetical protein